MEKKITDYLAKHKVHLVGYAHLDPVWLWPWRDGFSEVAATFRSALDRMNEYSDFIFTCPGACYYQWIEEYYPDMFQEICARVAEKRWIPVGGWWIQPDCNTPAGESFVRHSLYAQRYFLEKFGVLCDTGYNPDSFGHSGMIPQIMAKSGMNHYVFMRPDDKEKKNMPHMFYWESPDGSRVLAHKIPPPYTMHKASQFMKKLTDIVDIGMAEDTDMMLLYGVGNHGGGPTISQLNEIKSKQKEYGQERLLFSAPPQFFASVSDESYPIIADELQHHAIGCYSTALHIKKMNRLAENRLLAAESLDSLAHSLLKTSNQKDRLSAAWKKVLFNQFHDILCGCCIKKAFDDAAESYGYALYEADEIRNAAMQRIAWAVDTQDGGEWSVSKEDDWRLWGNNERGTPAIVFNPLPYEVEIPIEFHGEYRLITASDDCPLVTQRVRGPMSNHQTDRYNTLVYAKVPPMGYETFWLYRKDHDQDYTETSAAIVSKHSAIIMENDYMKITIDTLTGLISACDDKKVGTTVLCDSANPLVIDETHSDTWGHDLTEYRDVVGSFKPTGFEILEQGALRSRLRVTSTYNDSILTADFILYNDSPRLEVKYKVNWRETHKMLKIEFKTSVSDAVYTNEIPYGFVTRRQDGRENPIQRWVDMSNAKHGVTIINNACWAADCKDGDIRLTALRSPMFADHYGVRDVMSEPMEQGEHEFGYAVYVHGAVFNPSNEAAIYNAEYPIIYSTYHKGSLPRRLAGIQISGKGSVYVTTVKMAEDGDGMIVRAHENIGVHAQVTLALPHANRAWYASFNPHEIKTFHIPSMGDVREVNLLEMPV